MERVSVLRLHFLVAVLAAASSLCSSRAGSLLLLDILRDELLVLGGGLLGSLIAVELGSLGDLFAAEALLSNETLNLGGLVVSLVTTLDLAASDVAADVVLLDVEAEDGSDVALSLLEEARGHLLVGAAGNLGITLLHDLQRHDGEVRAGDAATDGTSSAVAGSLGVEEGALFLEEDAGSALSHDTLLHCETLSIVSAGNFENVAFVFLTKIFAFNFLSHSLLEEGADLSFIINLN